MEVHPEGGFLFDFGQFSSDEETDTLSLDLLTVSGRPNLWTPVSAEGEFSGLWAEVVLHNCQPDYEIMLGIKENKLFSNQLSASMSLSGTGFPIIDYIYEADQVHQFRKESIVPDAEFHQELSSIKNLHIHFQTPAQNNKQTRPLARRLAASTGETPTFMCPKKTPPFLGSVSLFCPQCMLFFCFTRNC